MFSSSSERSQMLCSLWGQHQNDLKSICSHGSDLQTFRLEVSLEDTQSRYCQLLAIDTFLFHTPLFVSIFFIRTPLGGDYFYFFNFTPYPLTSTISLNFIIKAFRRCSIQKKLHFPISTAQLPSLYRAVSTSLTNSFHLDTLPTLCCNHLVDSSSQFDPRPLGLKAVWISQVMMKQMQTSNPIKLAYLERKRCKCRGTNDTEAQDEGNHLQADNRGQEPQSC